MRVVPPSAPLPVVAALLLLLAACGGGSDGGGTQPTGGFTVSITPSSLNLQQGAVGQVDVTVTRTGGFQNVITLSIQGAPAGVTTTVDLALVFEVSTRTLSVTVGDQVAPGSYNLTVRGVATGQADRTATLTLIVTAAGGFTLAAAPSPVPVAQGASGQSTVTLTRTGGFTGAVALAVTGAPAGVTPTLAPTTIATGATSATLTLTVGAGVTPGTYPLVVTGTSAGLPAATVNITLTAVVPTPDFSLAVVPASISVAQGGEGTATVTLTRTGGFSEEISLALVDAPGGIAGSFAPAVLSGGTTTSTLTLSAAVPTPVGGHGLKATAPGEYTVTIRGFSEALTRDVTLAVTVTGSAFTVAVAPSTATVAQGASGQATVTVARSIGFLGGVALSVTGLPAGVTANFVPPSVLAGSTTSTMTLNVAGAVTPGAYPLVVTGSSLGWPASATNLALTVTAAPPGGGSIVWQFCDPAAAPLWFGVQDGASNWTRVTPTGANTYSFDFTSTAGGVAFVEPDGTGGFNTHILLASKVELTTLGANRCAETQPAKTHTGSVAGLAVTDNALIALGTAATAASGFLTNFTLRRVPAGNRTLIATQTSFNLMTATTSATKVIMRRNTNLADGAVIPVLNFGTEGFVPTVHNVTINNLSGWSATGLSQYFTDHGGSTGFLLSGTSSGTNVISVPMVPAGQQVAGDFQYITAGAIPNPLDPSQFRTVGRFFTTAAAQTITLGPLASVPNVSSVGGAGYARLLFTGTIQAEYVRLAQASYTQSGRLVTISSSWGYMGGAGFYILQMPDFTGVPGWLNAWTPALGVSTDWQMFVFGWDGGSILSQIPSEGAEVRSAGRVGQITP